MNDDVWHCDGCNARHIGVAHPTHVITIVTRVPIDGEDITIPETVRTCAAHTRYMAVAIAIDRARSTAATARAAVANLSPTDATVAEKLRHARGPR